MSSRVVTIRVNLSDECVRQFIEQMQGHRKDMPLVARLVDDLIVNDAAKRLPDHVSAA